jgi:hypothetical protein
LLAQRIEFDDPRTGAHREFASRRKLVAPSISAALQAGADARQVVADNDVSGPW